MNVVYEPKGRAGEYAPLAANEYNGCSHGCKYCYVPPIMRTSPERFHTLISQRNNFLDNLKKDLKLMASKKDERTVLLSFTCDPYQHIEEKLKVTSRAIDLFMQYDIAFTILTKGGERSIPDMKKYKDYPKATYATTLNTTDNELARAWEPHAAPPEERIKALATSRKLGIKNWVSVEPVVKPGDALDMISMTCHVVDHFKVGTLNHVHNKINWGKFRKDVEALLTWHKCSYYIKKDLREAVDTGKDHILPEPPDQDIELPDFKNSGESQKTLFDRP